MKVEFIVVARRWHPTLTGQLLAGQLAVLVAVLVLVALVSLAQSQATFERVEGRRVTALAEQLAAYPIVRARLEQPGVRTGLAAAAQGLLAQSGVDTVSIADDQEQVRVSTDARLEGAPLSLGSPAVASGAGWVGRTRSEGRAQLTAQVPVLADVTGQVGVQIGTVSVAADYPSARARLGEASSSLLTYLGLATVIGALGSWLLARRIKHQTLGLEPHEIAGMVEHREALLHGLAEGVIALDRRGRVTLVNDVARRLLDLPPHAVGMALTDLRVSGRLLELLAGAGDLGPDQIALRRGRVLALNRMTVTIDGQDVGTVTTLRDRTELAALERELGSFRSTTQALRAQAHEFDNQLHTISGLIQLGQHDEVVGYVSVLARQRQSLDLQVTSHVHDRPVAALLMAKGAQARERRVRLRVADSCALGRLSPADSADLATVVGNLLDNAIDAAADGAVRAAGDAGDAGDAWVEVSVQQDANTVSVTVRDSGPGVAPELAREVFTRGFTTKAAASGERGIGLALTRLVCQRRGGEVSVTDTEAGAMFSAVMTVSAAGAP